MHVSVQYTLEHQLIVKYTKHQGFIVFIHFTLQNERLAFRSLSNPRIIHVQKVNIVVIHTEKKANYFPLFFKFITSKESKVLL